VKVKNLNSSNSRILIVNTATNYLYLKKHESNKSLGMKKHLLFTLAIILLFISHSFSQNWNCGDTLIDVRDGKKYTTVLLGSQCWMQQNLNYGTFINSIIDTVTHSNMANNGVVEKYAPNGDSLNLPFYGALYEWDELMTYSTTVGIQGLCPNGWHVPTVSEWKTMLTATGVNLVGNIATSTGTAAGANKLKAVGTGIGPNGIGTNTSGFSALPGGDRDSYGIFYGLGNRYIFWTSNENTTETAYQFTLWNDNDTIYHYDDAQKITGFSCRCVLDNIMTGSIEENNPKETKIFISFSNDVLTITLNKSCTAQYQLYTSLGQLVFSEHLNTSDRKISLSTIRNGIYILVLSVKGELLITKKIIISHE
jgi:uncharacterized protein (TIGR02145 family)